MPQLSLYMNEVEMSNLRSVAKREGVSLSTYARRSLNRESRNNSWSPQFLKIFGSINDETFRVPEELPLDKEDLIL